MVEWHETATWMSSILLSHSTFTSCEHRHFVSDGETKFILSNDGVLYISRDTELLDTNQPFKLQEITVSRSITNCSENTPIKDLIERFSHKRNILFVFQMQVFIYILLGTDPFIRIPNPSDFENTNLLQLPSRSPWAERSSRASRPSFCLLRSSLFALPSAWNSLHLVTTNSIQFSSNIIKRLVQTLLLSSANNSTLSKQYLFNRTREKIKKHLNDKNTGLLLVNWRNEKRRNRGITEWKWTSSTRKMITKTEGTGSSKSWHISYFCEVMHIIIRRQDRDCFLPLNTSRKYFWKGNSCRNTMSNECERKKQACLRW